MGEAVAHNGQLLSKAAGVGCVSASRAFEFSNNILTIGQLSSRSAADLSNLYTEIGVPGFRNKGSALVTPAMIAYISEFKKQMDAKGLNLQIVVTDGMRTPEMQADRMYNIYKGSGAGELRALYGRSMPTAIEKFIDACRTSKKAAEEIVVGYADAGMNFSRHQSGLGVDFRTSNLSTGDVRKLIDIAIQTGGKPGFEPTRCKAGLYPAKRGCGNEHLHIGIPARFATVTAEDLASVTTARPGESSSGESSG